MFVQVRLLNGFSKPLTYQWPAAATQQPIGTVVRVPLRDRIVPAIVTNVLDQSYQPAFTVRAIIALEPFPQDPHYYQFITTVAPYYQTDAIKLIQLIRHFLRQRKSNDYVLPTNSYMHLPDTITLTPEQNAVTQFVSQALTKNIFCPTVLHGVTGSGKTEVYKQLIQEALRHGKTVLLLLPEVTLALRMAQLLREQLSPAIALHSFHSASSAAEKHALWQRLVNHLPTLIIGVHMPVLLPIANLGLIIVDEEHETGYQEKKHPKINSKDAAIMRAHMLAIPILLGSATPSISSLYNVKKRDWHFFQLKKRFAGAFAQVSTVLLTENKEKRRNFWMSAELDTAIARCLERKEQAILFINRRGYSFFVQCNACSFIFRCSNCSVSLTLHDGNKLTCHYCGFWCVQPSACPSCKASESTFIKKGIGTQQVVAIVQKLFPHARVGRADMDMTLKKKQWQATLNAFGHGELDILVGTQTIAKGFHFPNVTLVGILWADLNLHFPLYNASETCLQQLIQVAGRAGRQRCNSQVIVQTMTEHPIFKYINEESYLQFYADELRARSVTGYPPVMRLAEIEIKNNNEKQVEQDAERIVEQLDAGNNAKEIIILGPACPPVPMIQKVHCRKIYLKAGSANLLVRAFEALDYQHITSSVFFTPNPLC